MLTQHQVNRRVWVAMRIGGFTGAAGIAAAEGCLDALRATRQITLIQNNLALQFRDQIMRHHEAKEARRRAKTA